MSDIIKGCLGFKGEKGDTGEIGTPIPYDGTFAQLQNSSESKERYYIIMNEQDILYYKHWVYYDKIAKLWKDGGMYLSDLIVHPDELSEQQWAKLKTNMTNYYKRYERTYKTTTENEKRIEIGISQYNSGSILEVYIEGRILNRDEYKINGTNSITLTTPLSEIGTEVLFVVYRSVCATNEDFNKLKRRQGR